MRKNRKKKVGKPLSKGLPEKKGTGKGMSRMWETFSQWTTKKGLKHFPKKVCSKKQGEGIKAVCNNGKKTIRKQISFWGLGTTGLHQGHCSDHREPLT